jgi:hypothetical protein
MIKLIAVELESWHALLLRFSDGAGVYDFCTFIAANTGNDGAAS